MPYPIVYDVLLRTEVAAKNEQAALASIADQIATLGFQGIESGFEVIRDDNLFPGGKDNRSRHENGFVILSSKAKKELLLNIANALHAAQNGDSAIGEKLLSTLNRQFEYLEHTSLSIS